MNKIEKELNRNGWFNTRIERISCGSWPEKHIRITMWDSNKPTMISPITNEVIGYEYADGDGHSISEAFKNLKRNINNGYCKFFPGTYVNPVERDYKKWKKNMVSRKA
jgi:hypothetical protein